MLGSRATMHLARCRKFKPDILFVKSENPGRVKENQVEGPADMVVEIVSESTRDCDLQGEEAGLSGNRCGRMICRKADEG